MFVFSMVIYDLPMRTLIKKFMPKGRKMSAGFDCGIPTRDLLWGPPRILL